MFELFKRILPYKKTVGLEVDSSIQSNSAEGKRTISTSRSNIKYKVSSCQSTGIERPHNEDTLFTFGAFLDGLESSVSFGIYLVADGMGGHQSGEVASSLAAQGASQYLINHVFEDYLYGRQSFSDADLQNLVKESVEEAQTLITRRVPGGGTTLTMVMVVGDRLFSAHVGDSRLYFLGTNGKMILKTKDHSLVKRLVDLGEITEYEASIHPQRNVLYRALGQEESFEADTEKFSLKKGERLLICSDGLWGVIPDKKMLKIIGRSSDLDVIACNLVQAANESGGPDNISVVLIERI